MRAKAVETTLIGIIASEMGYADQSRVCISGKKVFEYIKTLTYSEFKNVKSL